MSKHTTSATPTTTTDSDVTPTGAGCTHQSHPAVCGRCQVDKWRAAGDSITRDVVVLATNEDGDLLLETDGAQARATIADVGLVALDVGSTDPADPFAASLCLTPDFAAALGRALLVLAAEARQEELDETPAAG